MAERQIENVLVLQGGGSLGAFACGVFKALYEGGLRFDLVSGTSIGYQRRNIHSYDYHYRDNSFHYPAMKKGDVIEH